MDALKDKLTSLFAAIPYTNYVKNKIGEYEGYYASVVYSYFAAMGVSLIAEDVTSTGRIDLTLLVRDKIYIIEFKVGNENALEQIKQKAYHVKYTDTAKEIYLIGINFDAQKKNISAFRWERVK